MTTTQHTTCGLVGIGNEKHQDHNEISSYLHVLIAWEWVRPAITTWGKELAVGEYLLAYVISTSCLVKPGESLVLEPARVDWLACLLDLHGGSGLDPYKHGKLEHGFKGRLARNDRDALLAWSQTHRLQERLMSSHRWFWPSPSTFNENLIVCVLIHQFSFWFK